VEIFAGLSVVVLVLVALAIAVKTFALWFRTRGRPELLLALYLTCATVTGYPLAIAMNQIPATESWPLHVAAQGIMSLGWISLLLFTLSVFRPRALWARLLVGVSIAWNASFGVAYVAEVTGENPRPPEEMPALVVSVSLTVAVAYFWTTFESLGYYRRLRLRMRLGLAEAAVADRMLLWGLMTLCAGVAVVLNMAVLVATGSYMNPVVVLLSSILGLLHASCLFLAFHPPRWYRDWVERRAPAAAA
jgi:hypothetical protein